MTDSLAGYHAIPSSEDQANSFDVHEAEVDEDDICSTSEHIPAETRTRWTYFLLGCAILLPWNVLVNATSFSLSRLAGSTFYPTFSSWLASVYTLTKLVSQVYSTFTSKQSSPSRRIFVSMIATVLLVISLCLSTFIQGTPTTFFVFALFNAACLAAANGYLCTGVYAGAPLLGASFLQTVLAGQAAIAVAVSGAQVASAIISIWGSSSKPAPVGVMRDDQGEEMAARIFFSTSTVFLCVTLAAYTWLTKQPFYKSATSTLEQHSGVGRQDERRPTGSNSRVYQVFRQNLNFMFPLAYVFTVTLSVYPAITVRVRPMNPGIHPLLFTSIHFLVMNIGDLLGRYSCSFPCLLVWSGKKILAMSLLRTLLIPLVLLCNIEQPATVRMSPILNSDIVFMIITLIIGYTTGYVSSMALLAVSSLEHNPRLKGREDVDVAATLGGSCMMLGLAFGALSSFGVQAMI